jgi:thioesterase domain-containing protein
MPDSSPSPLDPINAYLRTELPLTHAMGIAVTSWDGHTVTLTAPLAPNMNHADTAFGGSIAALGILAGYTLLFLAMRDRQISNRLLIQKSEVDFLRPIDTELRATATAPDSPTLDTFLETLRRKRRARISLPSSIFTGQLLAATHTGLYIAFLY